MNLSKGFVVFSIISGTVGMLVGVASLIDTIANGNKRAAITGQAAGATYYALEQNAKQQKKSKTNQVEK